MQIARAHQFLNLLQFHLSPPWFHQTKYRLRSFPFPHAARKTGSRPMSPSCSTPPHYTPPCTASRTNTSHTYRAVLVPCFGIAGKRMDSSRSTSKGAPEGWLRQIHSLVRDRARHRHSPVCQQHAALLGIPSRSGEETAILASAGNIQSHPSFQSSTARSSRKDNVSPVRHTRQTDRMKAEANRQSARPRDVQPEPTKRWAYP